MMPHRGFVRRPNAHSLLGRSVCVVTLLAFVAAGAAAFDWGGTLDNTTGIQAPPAGVTNPTLGDMLVQRTALSLWMTQPLGGFTVRAEGSYVFTPAVPVLLDIDELSLKGRFAAAAQGPSAVSVALGRFDVADPTGLVLSHTLDGALTTLGWRGMQTTLGVGTTALILKPSSQIVLSDADAEDRADPQLRFTTPRIIAVADLRLIDSVAGQNITLAGVIQEDLRPADALTDPGTEAPVDGSGNIVADPTAVGRTDTQYLTLQIAGPIIADLFHKTSYTLNTGRAFSALADLDSGTGYSFQYAPILAHMVSAEISYYLPGLLSSRVRVSGLYSSGDPDLQSVFGKNTADRYTAFLPLTPSGFSELNSLQPGNSSHAAVRYTLKPLSSLGLEWIRTEAGAVAYFRSAGTGPVSLAAVDRTTTGAYVGSGIDVAVNAQPFSDLRVALATGFFFPNESVMAPGNEKLDYTVTLQGVLRF